MAFQVEGIQLGMPNGDPRHFPETNSLSIPNYISATGAMFASKNAVEFCRLIQLGTNTISDYFEITIENLEVLRFLETFPFFDFMKGFWSFFAIGNDILKLSELCEKTKPTLLQAPTKYCIPYTSQIVDHFKKDRPLQNLLDETPITEETDYSSSLYWITNWGDFDKKVCVAETSLSLIVNILWAFNFAFSAIALLIAHSLPIFIPIAIIAETVHALNMILGICHIQALNKPKIYAEDQDFQKWENPQWIDDVDYKAEHAKENMTKAALHQIHRAAIIDINSQNFELAIKIFNLAVAIISIIGFCYLGIMIGVAFPVYKLVQLTMGQGLKAAKEFQQKLWDAEKDIIKTAVKNECLTAEDRFLRYKSDRNPSSIPRPDTTFPDTPDSRASQTPLHFSK